MMGCRRQHLLAVLRILRILLPPGESVILFFLKGKRSFREYPGNSHYGVLCSLICSCEDVTLKNIFIRAPALVINILRLVDEPCPRKSSSYMRQNVFLRNNFVLLKKTFRRMQRKINGQVFGIFDLFVAHPQDTSYTSFLSLEW